MEKIKSKTGFTPGPWRRAGIPKQYDFEAINADGCTITKIHLSGEAAQRNEVESNINLICAAPDLYETLFEIIEAGMCVGERIVRAKAALAKARGEA